MPSNVSERRAGTLQGILLLLPITTAVMGIVVLSPILPRLQTQFMSTPGAAYLVPMVLTLPGLCIALLSPIAGGLVDAFGRRRTLIVALVLYAAVGVLPAILSDLRGIIVTRAVLGVMEAVILTASTTLIADYFHGTEREKWFAYQSAFANAAATVLFAVGGALGNVSWRAPFVTYSVSLLFAAGILLWTWEPGRVEASPIADPGAVSTAFPWRTLLPKCLIAVLGGVMFFTMQIQLGLLLGRYFGIRTPGEIGPLIAVGGLALLLGSLAYRHLARLRLPVQLLISFGLIGSSFLLMGLGNTVSQVMAYDVINQFGCGILLPALVIWVMAPLPFALRGRGVGLFMSCWWIGQFLSPQGVTLLAARLGGLLAALQVLGVLSLAVAAAAMMAGLRRSARPIQS